MTQLSEHDVAEPPESAMVLLLLVAPEGRPRRRAWWLLWIVAGAVALFPAAPAWTIRPRHGPIEDGGADD